MGSPHPHNMQNSRTATRSLWLRYVASLGITTACLLAGLDLRTPAQTVNPQLAQTVEPTSTVSQQLLFVNPTIGSDSGDGSQRMPFRTITQALTAAQPNTVIMLAAGTYSVETGEQFPMRLRAGVTLQGDPGTRGRGIVIRGGGTFLSPTFASQNVAIVGAHQARITGITVSNPTPRGYGLWIESNSLSVTNNTFSNSAHDGISITGNSSPLIQSNTFTQNGANGITIYGTSQPEIRGNSFERTGFGINIAQNAAPRIVNNQLSQNQDGIVVQGNARPVLRNNIIEGSARDGLVAIAQSQPDLGTAAEAGNNIFRNNGRYDINAEAARQRFPAAGNQLTSDRLVGQVDLTGTATPAPIAATVNQPAVTPSARAPLAPAPVAVTPSARTPLAPAPVVVTPAPERPPANAVTASNRPSVSPAPSTSTPSGLSTLPRLASAPTNTVAQTAPPPPVSRSVTSSTSFPTPNPSAASAPSTSLPARSTPQSSTSSRGPSARTGAIEIPVSPPAAVRPSTSSTRSPLPSSARSVVVTRPTRASAGIEIPVPPPASTRSPQSTPRPSPTSQRPTQVVSVRASASPQAPRAIEIPVPPPNSSQIPQASVQTAAVPGRVPNITTSAPSGDLLPVPGSNIPVGNVGDMPRIAVSRNPLQQIASAAPVPSQAAALGLRYRVVVEANSETTQAQVRSIVPSAFRTYANGRVVMQVGAYSDRINAEEAAQMLNSNGISAIVQLVE